MMMVIIIIIRAGRGQRSRLRKNKEKLLPVVSLNDFGQRIPLQGDLTYKRRKYLFSHQRLYKV